MFEEQWGNYLKGAVVDGEAGQVERLLVAGLPAGVGRQRAAQEEVTGSNPVAPTGYHC